MSLSRFFLNCQSVFEKGHESWNSYFSKWQNFAKYEEKISETYVDNQSDFVVKLLDKKKKKCIPHNTKKRTVSLITLKKNQKRPKKVIKKKRKRISVKRKKVPETTATDFGKQNEDTGNEALETDIQGIFKDFFRENKNKTDMFSVLSLTFSSSLQNISLKPQQALHHSDFQSNERTVFCMNQLTLFPEDRNIKNNMLISPVRTSYTEYASRVMSSPKFRHKLELRNDALVDRYSRFGFSFKNNCDQTNIDPVSKINLGGKSSFPSLLKSHSYESLELKPLDWDFSHKSPVSVCRKINKEYFIKRTFPKMNITLDGKRFRNLCLHKRTNSVSLSMENSNFTTPERKPPERKCFSENVLQRKRRCPSKLFFDNEEDSESDDQTENQHPLIHYKNKKLKTQTLTQVLESDSEDDYNIFDKVKRN